MADNDHRAGPGGSAVIDDGAVTRDSRGEWKPRVLGKAMPFAWPVQPKKLLRFFLGYPGFLWPFGAAAYYVLGAVTWRYLQPGADDLSYFSQLRVEWIVPMYARNLLMLLATAGPLHLILYWRRVQGTRFKYNSRWPSTNSKAFLFSDQVKDNMTWTLASGGTVWTLYEVMMLWAYGNGWVPFTSFHDNPVWFIALGLLLPFWQDLHFYLVHRISHWKPIYDCSHHVHHRNTNVGPWSGLSMHPIEHLLYFTRWIILFVVPSHPIHMFYLMQRPAINPALGHTGFDRIVLKEEDEGLSVDSYFHYLHHRFFECNYGTATVPLDRWFGTLHDGTPESYEQMRGKRRLPTEARANAVI
jgi:sterol desaturase/sphingolipid hydroxylase (fatty acid hydroxylase superfamily)